MKVFGVSLAIVALAASPIIAAPGDVWILGIHDIHNAELFTTYTGAGYSGPKSSGNANYVGNAYGYNMFDGVARVIWELSGNAINSGLSVPTTPELYSLEFYGTADGGHNDWQPVESQFHGIVGEGYPYEPSIPWAGQFETNHQWLGSTGRDDGQWHIMNNDDEGGPQAPSGPDFNATGYDGIYLWLTRGSWLYAKWNFSFEFDRSWSALRLTQVTGAPPPELEGDYNQDGRVDAADYIVWRKNNINGQDGFNTWRANFGLSAGGGSGYAAASSAVPEPTSIALLASAVFGMARFARRRA